MTSLLTKAKSVITSIFHNQEVLGWLDAEFVKEKNILVDALATKFGPDVATMIHDIQDKAMSNADKLFGVATSAAALILSKGATVPFGAVINLVQTMFDQLKDDAGAEAVKAATKVVNTLPSMVQNAAANPLPASEGTTPATTAEPTKA